ncbi:photosystem II reaction center protein PsbM [Nitzschia inconspicua]|uniref:Photosystem II reaction center protein PsbM n=1 Tax=Nitzschia inconspicua TaxID=303405 RepID=A0A9K3LFR1_9STRA|nr:photosystem II reaction center protein PsbM [Nitzschia inconspicua]KAG7361217.1 photosystem II reaction center protein PsbM [Nitzschia inconspicua]
MKTFQIVTLFALVAASMAFAPNQTPQVAKTFAKGAAASVPVAALAAPAFAMDSIVDALPTTSLSLEVQFGAYLAVLLGTFLPALFLINLYIQTETRKAGAEDALNDEF